MCFHRIPVERLIQNKVHFFENNSRRMYLMRSCLLTLAQKLCDSNSRNSSWLVGKLSSASSSFFFSHPCSQQQPLMGSNSDDDKLGPHDNKWQQKIPAADRTRTSFILLVVLALRLWYYTNKNIIVTRGFHVILI